MQTDDFQNFRTGLCGVYAFYGKDVHPFALDIWWGAMHPFDLAAVTDAFNRHLMNPDTGQFLPKPADIVRMLQGTTQDAALVAWSKVDRAVRHVGTYQSVVFDDALIHRVLSEMGGWVAMGTKSEDEWPFVRNEFVNRYRGYRMASKVPDYLPKLIGIAEAQNSRQGFNSELPMLIGNAEQAKRVMQGGTDQPMIGLTRLQLLHVKQQHIEHHQRATA